MKRRILVADDNEHIRMILTEFLKYDYDIIAFSCGSEILNFLGQGNIPDMIISDVMMPNLNGWDLINKLKISNSYNKIPVVILSGIEKSQEKVKFLEAGVEEYMIKPFNPEELKIRINKIFKRSVITTDNQF